jgi:hypothetical protein
METVANNWGSMAEVITAVATGLALIVAILAIRAKRRDDRRADRLSRINRQLSQLYGKLSILEEAGSKNWNSFVFQHSNDIKALGREFMRFFPYDPREDQPITKFNPAVPNAEQLTAYRKWLRTLFMKTNEGMLEVIYNNSDLVVGEKMPIFFVGFAEHVASLRLLVLKLDEVEKSEDGEAKSAFLADWNEHVKNVAPHPEDIGIHISASFEVLKEEQERLLSTHGTPLTEKEIVYKIAMRQWKKKDAWGRRGHAAREKVGLYYTYKSPDKPEPLTSSWWRSLIN